MFIVLDRITYCQLEQESSDEKPWKKDPGPALTNRGGCNHRIEEWIIQSLYFISQYTHIIRSPVFSREKLRVEPPKLATQEFVH